jgi:tetratricopeptide (TPR) repeat protein
MTPFGTLILALFPVVSSPADTVPLYDDLGSHHREITTQVALTQQYFDQGLRLTYAFNHAEAIRAFDEAARLDPNCAMCYWGTALAYGPNINAPMDSTSGVKAYAAAQQALAHLPHASERERAFIEALATRYAAVPPANRAALDSAYADAMEEVVDQYPDDQDAAVLYAESRMVLRPWNYWTKEGEPYPGTQEVVELIEGVVAKNPDHPGACHFYIHAVEAVSPEKAVPCAERLAGLMPGAGHIVHMPAHIYVRVGRYGEAVDSNVHAVHTDETFIADQGPAGIYPGFYYPHNYHFLSFASTMAGRSKGAIEAAHPTAAKMPLEIARMVPDGERLLAQPHVTLATFGRWEEVLAEPVPPSDLRLATGLVQYARGAALAATGRYDEAEAALDSVNQIASAYNPDLGWPKTVLELASHVLQGDLAARRGQTEQAIEHYRLATGLQDGLQYTEPPYWHQPVRHLLGAALLEAGRAAEAETAYREDLERFPDNGWSLFGLAASLRAQGKTAEADEVEARFQQAWQGADVTLTASRF